MNLAEVMSKLAGSFCLVEQLVPTHTCTLLGERWVDHT